MPPRRGGATSVRSLCRSAAMAELGTARRGRACRLAAGLRLGRDRRPLVAAAFLLGGGIERVAPAARGAYAVRPLLVPGLVLLWPLVLWRWAALARGGA